MFRTTPRETSRKPPFHVARPLSSPRHTACKRSLEPELKAADLSFELSETESTESSTPERKQKQPKREFLRNVQILEQVLPVTPEKKSTKTVETTPECLEAKQKLPSLRGPRPDKALDEAVATAMSVYTKALTDYVLERDRLKSEGLDGEVTADKYATEWAAEHYEELKSAILGLLPWTGEMEQVTGDVSYDVIKFHGRKTNPRNFKNKLQHFRSEGAQCRAWEALCAVMSAISSREEKVWLEFNDVQEVVAEMLQEKKLSKTKNGDARRNAAIRELIATEVVPEGPGGFAESLIDPRGVHAVTFARGPEGPLPATSMCTRRLPLWDALKTMDDDGPLRSDAADKAWCFASGSQFALQDLQYGHKDGSKMERKAAQQLLPDKALRDLLRSKKPVVLLDTLAALAPRDICKSNGLSKIVTAELHNLLREAKARGEAVVFSLGSDVPHKLAQRVYLRPPLANYGMRVGSLRWRESAGEPWAREFRWEDRITLCVQMP